MAKKNAKKIENREEKKTNLEEMEVDFPRGGESSLTPMEYRDITEQVNKDLFEQKEESIDKKKKKKRKSIDEDSTSENKKQKLDNTIRLLNFKHLKVGMCILGAIKEINELELVISLPNGLTGFVSITEISEEISKIAEQVANDDNDEEELPELNSLFTIGQLIACAVSELSDVSNKKKINLSIKPSIVNATLISKDISTGMMLNSEVVSKEDHGYVMSTGIDGVKAFLNSKNIPEDVTLTIGQVISCSVASIDGNFRTVQLTLKKEAIVKSVIPNKSSPSLTSLKPGALVNTYIKKVLDSGLQCTFCGIFNATIDIFNLSTEKPIDQLYKEKQKIRARIIYINYSKLKIGLSLNKNLIEYEPISFPNIRIGTILDNVKIKRIDEAIGTLVTFNDDVQGYVHVSRLDDKHVDNISKKFSIGSTHKGRVVGLDYFGDIVHLSFQQSILNIKYFTYEDIEVGSVIKGTIAKLGNFGLLINLNDHIKVLCPKRHFSDVQLKNPEKKFKKDAQVKFRVLEVIPKLKKVVVTLRKSLVDSTLPIISSYDNIEKGMITMGVIEAVKKFGCIVKFYNQVHGLCPIHELSEDFIKNPEDHFKVNQVVKCRVMDFNKDESKLRVSFKLLNVEQQENFEKVQVGEIVSGKVIYTVDDGALIELNNMNGIRCFLPKVHMSDFESNAEDIHSQLKEGSVLNNLMVLYKDKSNNQIFLTMKKLLVEAHKAKQLPDKFEQVKVNNLIPGYVKYITTNYSVISFLDELIGVVIKDNVSDDYVKSIDSKLKLGKTVIALVTEIDKEKKQFNLSLKFSECEKADNAKKYINKDMSNYFTTFDEISITNYEAKKEKNRKKNLEQWKNLFIGGPVEGFIKTNVPAGTVVELKSKITGLILKEHFEGEEKKIGTSVKGRIMDIDIKNNVVNITMKSDLVKGNAKIPKELTVKGKTVDAIVQLVKQNYVIVSLPKYGHQFAYLSENSYNKPEINHISKYSIGQSISVITLGVLKSDVGFERLLLKLNASSKNAVVDTRRIIKDPIDKSITALEDLIPGKEIKGRIKGVKKTQINVTLGSNLKGRIHITEVFDKLEDVKDKSKPLANYKAGQIINCRVIGVFNSKGYKYLPLTHRNPISQTTIELSVKPSRMALAPNTMGSPILSIEDVKVGSIILGAVSNVTDNAVWMYVGPQLLGRVVLSELSNDPKIVENFKKNFLEGQIYPCYILNKNTKKGLLDISLRDAVDGKKEVKTIDNVKVGDILMGKVIKVNENKGINIRINNRLIGRAYITDIKDVFEKNPTKDFKVGQIVSTYVLNVDKSNKQVDLSLRKSRVNNEKCEDKNAAADIQTFEDVKEDMIVYGYIKLVSDKGCFVTLSSHLDARVKIAELSDLYVKEWKNLVSVGQLVKGRVISIDKSNKRIELTLKESIVSPETAKKVIQWSDLSKGQKVTGIIKGIEEFGVFIRIDNSNISGLCHKAELSDTSVKDITKLYSVGDKVKAYITKVDLEKKRVSFSLKASYFADDDDSDEENEMDEDVEENKQIMENVENDEEEDEEENEEENDDDDDDEDNEMDVDDKETTIDNAPKSILNAPELEISQRWDDDDDSDNEKFDMSDDDDNDDDDDDNETKNESTKKSKRAKKREKLEREEKIREQEKMILDNDKLPEMADDFERLLLGSPNSSYIWIKYMAFQLHMAEVEKARQIAERALKTINYREEQEKMNIWIAYMNLENSYGTQESLLKVFERAVTLCEPKDIYMQLVKIYERSEKYDLAEQLYQTMIKRFRESSKIWCQCGLFYLKRNNIAECRKILQRSLQSLAKRKHIKTICKFAQMEFRYGEPERGRTIFEGIMSSYPKRVDLWSIYLDMEIRQGDQNLIRRLFERVIHMKFSSKKMKFFFKRYLEYEKKHGDEESIAHVKNAALEYIQTLQ
jgi:rRNA biogenesis protein RRP5